MWKSTSQNHESLSRHEHCHEVNYEPLRHDCVGRKREYITFHSSGALIAHTFVCVETCLLLPCPSRHYNVRWQRWRYHNNGRNRCYNRPLEHSGNLNNNKRLRRWSVCFELACLLVGHRA